MKTTTYLLLVFLLFTPLSTVQAQYYRFGGKAGGGFATAKGDDAPSERINHVAGLNAGFVFSYDFASALALQPELQYSQKGFVYDNYLIAPDEAVAGDIRLHYLELPLMLRAQKGGLFVEAGPYAAYLLRQGSDSERISALNTGTAPIVLGNYEPGLADYERFDYGYAVGLGIMLETGFFLSIRHTGGLPSFSKELDQKNRVWQLSIGYLRPHRRPVDY